MRHTCPLFFALSIALACGGDDEETGGSDSSMGAGTETDGTGGGTSDGPTTSPTTTSPTTTAETTQTTDPTGDPDSGDASDSGDETAGDSAETGGDAVSFGASIWPIINGNCSCHMSGSHPTGLTMSSESVAYDNLVGAMATQADLNRVQPGSATDSYMWHKISGTQEDAGGTGGRMPFGAAPLSQDDIDLVAKWIDEGAAP